MSQYNGHGEAADSECRSTEDREPSEEKEINTSPNEDNGRSDIQPTLQENIVFVDSPTGPTTIIIDSCNPVVSLGSNGDSRHNFTQCMELAQDEAAGDTHPESTTSTSHAATDDVPTDIAAGPDQPPVQPKIKLISNHTEGE